MLQLFRKIAFPFSLIYALVVRTRNYLYDIGFFTSVSYSTPTICVGNLSVGGTGKTPMIEYLIWVLEGQNVAVLSRGYKRKSKGFVLAGPNSTVGDLGDEPFQIYKKFPKVVVAVDADRRNGITKLESLIKPDVILLDDAFQHRRVKPKYSILLTAYDNLYMNDWYLPTGNLRDSKLEAKRADMIVVTKCPKLPSLDERSTISKKLKSKPHQKVLFANLEYDGQIKGKSRQKLELSALRKRKIALVTGIASPGPLLQFLEDKEIEFHHFQFPDHHDFSPLEIQSFRDFEVILTTEKDYVRLEGKLENLYYLEVAHGFSDEDRKIMEKTINKLI